MADVPDNILMFPKCDQIGVTPAREPVASPTAILAEILGAGSEPAAVIDKEVVVEQIIEGDGNVQVAHGSVARQVIRGNGNVQVSGVGEHRGHAWGKR